MRRFMTQCVIQKRFDRSCEHKGSQRYAPKGHEDTRPPAFLLCSGSNAGLQAGGALLASR
jgi:hypothetical protein